MKKLLLWTIGFYRKSISPAFPPSCRFMPTCSAYALEAIEVHGAVRGGVMALYRFLRCNPFAAAGYDPVPPKRAVSHKGE
jgi:hypothetical protein